MLIDSGMHKCYWGEALYTANYIQNKVLTRSTGCTPFEKWFGQLPKFENFNVFGSDACVWIPKEKRRKLDDRAEKFKFVGYDADIISRDVKFLEDSKDVLKSINVVPNISEFLINLDDDEKNVYVRSEADCSSSSENDFYDFKDEENGGSNTISQAEEVVASGSEGNLRKSNRSNFGVPSRYLDKYICCTSEAVEELEEPRNYKEAINRSDKKRWIEAMNDEIKSIEENNVFELGFTSWKKCYWFKMGF
jgi:hypothetical protein